MTIGRGGSWGETVDRPVDLTVVADDAALAEEIDSADSPVAVAGGDMFATVGARPIGDRDELLRLPVDLVAVSLDGVRRVAVAHVVFRAPWWRGGALREAVTVVMNAEFLAGRPVAPRGHPNDGRVEVFELAPDVSARQRLAIRRRAKNASHLPHPGISTRSVKSATWTFDRPHVAVVDGRVVGRVHEASIEVLADAGALYA